ncbi:phage tail tube protein [Parachitinimonas caeni]|uniref:Uncharacterized protein n=1 Tax=Parachitinimonas caeni TaxID=3031301 RepID=A0ABT7DXE3_9NEIS|nr:hypothetical protein [Parachitinimonas caeni]MDK2124494.1 hypothetical protein [Parachitinimonas caeni]
MTQRKRSFIGKGIVRLAQAGTDRYFEVGNCSKLEFTHNEKTMELPDYQHSGGGTAAYHTRIEGVEIALSLRIFSPDNLARCIHGDVDALTASSNQTLSLQAAKGGFVPTPCLINPASAVLKSATPPAWTANTAYALGARIKAGSKSYVVTVAGTSAAVVPTWPTTTNDTVVDGGITWKCEGNYTATTYVAGTDFVASAAGISFPAGSSIDDLTPLELSYDRPAQFSIDALSHGARDWSLHFEGMNEADSDSPVVVSVALAKFGATKNLPLIGDEFAALELSGKVLRSGEGSGDSAYYRLLQAAA